MLTTLLVLDEFGEGQPVAWCLSNHETEEFLIIFFRYIRAACGQVKAAWFMADLAPQAYNAFCIVMEWGPLRLFCTWHVDKAWKEELRSKIKDDFLAAVVYQMLRLILQQLGEGLFVVQLSGFMKQLESPGTNELLVYFQTQWVTNARQWA